MVDFDLNSRYTKIKGFHPPKARCSASESNTQSHVTNQLDFTYLVSHSPHHSLLSTSPPRPLRVPRLTPPANFPPSTNVWALNTSHLIPWTGFPTHIHNLPILQVRHWGSKNLSHLSNIPCGSARKESAYNVEDQDSITWLGRPREKGKATHSSILAWRIPWTAQSMGSRRVRHDWATLTFTFVQYPTTTSPGVGHSNTHIPQLRNILSPSNTRESQLGNGVNVQSPHCPPEGNRQVKDKQGGRHTRLGREQLMGCQRIISMEEPRKQKMVRK